MGLKQDLIDAKIKAAEESGVTTPLDTSNGSFIELEAEYTKEALINFLTEAGNFLTKFDFSKFTNNISFRKNKT